MKKDSRIYVSGHMGLVGSSLVRRLKSEGYDNLVLRTHAELDLCEQASVRKFFNENKIEYVFLCAARVGGIHANLTQKADFLYDNLMITTNILKASLDSGVRKVLNLGTSCAYPRDAAQPMPEECLLEGKPEPTNEGYAIAKIAGLKLAQFYHEQYGRNFVSVMPTNLYGIGDNFSPEHSHVIPGLLRRFHEAKISGAGSVTVWGSGRPLREFLYIDDLTEALMLVMDKYDSPEILNIGYGTDVSIFDLAHFVKTATQYEGDILFDTTKPDGNPRKLLNSNRLFALGWSPKVSLLQGLSKTYQWALNTGVLAASATSANVERGFGSTEKPEYRTLG